MLNSFATSTGVHVNYQKSNVYLINASDEKMDILAKTFSCKIGVSLSLIRPAYGDHQTKVGFINTSYTKD